MTPDWPALWAREPGLRPKGLLLGNDKHWYVKYQNENGYGRDDWTCEQTVAALCRDAAVAFVLDSDPECQIYTRAGDFFIAGAHGVVNRGELGAALHDYCTLILDARDTAKVKA